MQIFYFKKSWIFHYKNIQYHAPMTSSHKLVIKDAAWQLFGRVISALFGFIITKIIASYLWPLRYGDYGTIFRFFARWTALVDFGIYVIAVKRLWAIKEQQDNTQQHNLLTSSDETNWNLLHQTYHKFLWTRVFMIIIIYTIAIITAYLIPAYTDNQFIIRGLPLAMLYSASNMFVWIQQLPLQLFWKMNRLSRSLIIARFSQLAVLLPTVYLIFRWVNFENDWPATPTMIFAFCMVVFSVVASSIWQNFEIHHRSKELLPFKIDIDLFFIKKTFTENRKYGFSYFFSSFHTLLVLMFMGRFFPTAEGFKYVWFWALALSLIEILLIIPSSLWNSLLHKIPNYTIENKKKSFGNLLCLIARIWILIAINFTVFNSEIIRFVSSHEFIGSRWNLVNRGSNQILPFLWIVLCLSFIKQVFNYLFVAVEKQNVLFWNNLIWVAVWAIVGFFIIPKRNLLWWIITQILLEMMFTCWAILIAQKQKLLPILQKKIVLKLTLILLLAWILWGFINHFLAWELNILKFIISALIFNLFIIFISLKPIKSIAKWLTID